MKNRVYEGPFPHSDFHLCMVILVNVIQSQECKGAFIIYIAGVGTEEKYRLKPKKVTYLTIMSLNM